MCELIEAARDLVNKGFYIIPLRPLQKIPASKNGVKDAECSQDFVTEWWGKGQQYNIGIACKNIIVIDVDVKSGDGLSELKQMEQEFGILSTKGKVSTPSGGVHYYFKNPHADINGQTHIEFHGKQTQIDVRVDNQFVVAPPSFLANGVYSWDIEPFNIDNLPDLPKAWLDFLPKRKQRPIQSAIQSSEAQWYDSIPVWERHEQCKRYLSKTTYPAIQGQKGQNQMFKMANLIFNGFAMKPDEAWDIWLDYNSKAIPPWPIDARWLGDCARKAYDTAFSTGGKLRAPSSYSNFPPSIESKHETITEFVDTLPEINIEPIVQTNIDRWSDDYVPTAPQEIDKDDYISEDLLEVPGFISDCMGILERNTTFFNKYTSFTGLLALMSTLAGPHFTTHGLYGNMYLIALSGSGTGKDKVRKFNADILVDCGALEIPGRNFASGEALEDSVIKAGVKLFQIDECDFLFKTISQGKESYHRNIQQNLLEFYTTVDGCWTRRENAMGAKISGTDKTRWNPFLSLFGTAPPAHYYEAMSKRVTEGGLFGRMIVIKSPGCVIDQKKSGEYKSDEQYIHVLKSAKFFLDFVANETEDRNLAGKTGPITPYSIPLSDEALDKFTAFNDRANALSLEPDCDESKKAIYNRAVEKAYKFALLYELSRKAELLSCCRDERGCIDLDQVRNLLEIDLDAATWAIRLSQQMVNLQLKDLKQYFYENEYEKNCNLIFELIKQGVRNYPLVDKSWLYSQTPSLSVQDIDSVLSDLFERKQIEFCELIDKAGNKQKGIRLTKGKKK